MSELLDNRAHRVRVLREIIERLHDGADPARLRGELRGLIESCDADEIAAMEQQLIDGGVSIEKIMGMCDLHASVVGEVLQEAGRPPVPTGHPVDVFLRENEALRASIAGFGAALGAGDLLGCRERFNEIMDIDKHYSRKEHLLFSCLERHGITGPSTVMWGKDDEVRALLAELGRALDAGADWSRAATAAADRAFGAIESMMHKEEQILIPMALSHLSELEWGEIHRQSPEYGWCLIDPGGAYAPPDGARPSGPPADTGGADGASGPGSVAVRGENGDISLGMMPSGRAPKPPSDAIMFPTGSLTPGQLEAIFKTLPLDLTFVDADDRVRFFSEGPRRVFVRPKAVIGRKVQHCHPPASVDTVDRILDDFRSGRQSVADFWINHKGRFVFIRYFAVRDEDGTYLGTLEMTQDISRERSLEGERRLLEYD